MKQKKRGNKKYSKRVNKESLEKMKYEISNELGVNATSSCKARNKCSSKGECKARK